MGMVIEGGVLKKYNDDPGITALIVPPAVLEIAPCAFCGSALRHVIVSEGVKEIGRMAFCDCTELLSVTLPKSLRYMGYRTFGGCENLKNVKLPASGFNFADGCFCGCTSLETVTLPADLGSVPEMTFAECTSLKEIQIPDSVRCIGTRAFRGCTSLFSVTIPDNVREIDSFAFEGCNMLTVIDMPDDIKLKYGCFRGTSWIGSEVDFCIYNGNLLQYNGCEQHVVIPDCVKTVSAYAFQSADTVETIEMPDSIEDIEMYAFAECAHLKKVWLSENLGTVSKGAFSGCTELESIDLSGVVYIEPEAFRDCISLRDVTMPDDPELCMIEAADDAFSGTPFELKEEGFVIVDGYLVKYTGKAADVEVPEGVKAICPWAFVYSNVESVVLPEGVTVIGANAFSECRFLDTIIIPETVRCIGRYAFVHTQIYPDMMPENLLCSPDVFRGDKDYNCFNGGYEPFI